MIKEKVEYLRSKNSLKQIVQECLTTGWFSLQLNNKPWIVVEGLPNDLLVLLWRANGEGPSDERGTCSTEESKKNKHKELAHKMSVQNSTGRKWLRGL